MQHRRPLTVVALVFSCVSATAAQTRSHIEFRKVGDKTITCQRRPNSNLDDCGFRPAWPVGAGYDYVFVGSISAVSAYGKVEKKLQASPEKVFQGEPSNPLIVRTSQGACQTSLAVGDRWLFFLVNGWAAGPCELKTSWLPKMNVFELIIFLLVCAGLGFAGHLVWPRYGWGVGAVLGLLVLILLGSGRLRKAAQRIRESRRER